MFTSLFFANENASHGLVTFRAAVFLMGCARMGIEAFVATWSMATSFFLGFFFVIALARIVVA